MRSGGEKSVHQRVYMTVTDQAAYGDVICGPAVMYSTHNHECSAGAVMAPTTGPASIEPVFHRYISATLRRKPDDSRARVDFSDG